ncbi:MAG TPA: DUF4395 domain-containing protein [Ktedonobacteraceae bacterium]|jgi:hypothetical protein|nr:DUF4395 domain-containing protein [Ktedonobacteraceae bacterium]
MSATGVATPRLDAHLGKFSQASTFVLAGLAFVFFQPIIVLITGLILALSALVPAIGPYRLVYRSILVPLHILKPKIVEDDPAPHRFAQGVGAVFTLASALVLLLSQATALGWTLDLIVFVLSGLNLFVGFCAGCFVYYHLGRLGVAPRVRYEGGFHWRGV